MNEDNAVKSDAFSANEQMAVNVLNKIQAENGYIPRELLVEIAERLNIPEAQLQELVSFFKSYRIRPAGRHKIRICYGTACYARGAALINDRFNEVLNLNDSDTSPDGLVTIEKVYCVGACSQAPVIIQDEKIKSRIKSFQVPLMVDDLRKQP